MSSDESSPAAVGAATDALPASDRGVTSTSVKVAFMLLSVDSVAKIGIAVPGIDPEQQKRAWQIYIDDLNRRGGVVGRKIDPVYQTYDVLSQDSMRTACQAVTRDAKVFAAIDVGGIYGGPMMCFTEENQTPLLSLGTGIPKEWYARSQGRLFSLFPSGVRTLQNLVAELERMGHLKGKTIGVVSDADIDPSGQTIQTGAIDSLEQLGYKVAHHARLSADRGTAASQVPVEVQQMRTKQVDTVLLLVGGLNATMFVQNADGGGYRPTYFVSDWGSGYSDTWPQNMPASFDGTLAITSNRTGEFRVGKPEPQYEVQCRQTFEKAAGRKVDRSTIEYNGTVRICNLLDLFARGATGAGAQLTRPRWSQAMQSLGDVPLATFGGGGFRPNKFDAADQVRTIRFEYSPCKCWKPVDEFRKGRF